MSNRVRMLVLVLVAAFAAGTVAHAANATGMTLEMQHAAPIDGEPADCRGCSGDDGSTAVCDQICVAPLIVLPTETACPQTMAGHEYAGAPPRRLAGRSGPPATDPPRAIFPG
jgi:hypothetical protein